MTPYGHKAKLQKLRADFDEARGMLEFLQATANSLRDAKPSEKLENVDTLCDGLDNGFSLLLRQMDEAITECDQ